MIVGCLVETGLGVQAPAQRPSFTAHAAHLSRVLDSLGAQVRFQVAGQCIERLLVGLDPEAVVAGLPGCQQRGAAPGQRVQHLQRSGTGDLAERQMQEQPGECLVGLARVLGNGDQVVVHHLQIRQVQGTQPAVGLLEAHQK